MKNYKFKHALYLIAFTPFFILSSTHSSDDPFGNHNDSVKASQNPLKKSGDPFGTKKSEEKKSQETKKNNSAKTADGAFAHGEGDENDHRANQTNSSKKESACWPLSICGINLFCMDCIWPIIWGMNFAGSGMIIASIVMNAYMTKDII